MIFPIVVAITFYIQAVKFDLNKLQETLKGLFIYPIVSIFTGMVLGYLERAFLIHINPEVFNYDFELLYELRALVSIITGLIICVIVYRKSRLKGLKQMNNLDQKVEQFGNSKSRGGNFE